MLRSTDVRVAVVVAAAAAACAFAFSAASASDGAPSAPPAGRDASLLVVAPRSLAAAMAPFVAHKTKTGMPARLVVVESLEPKSGRDDAERVKRAIFAAHEQGVRYVLLVGDASRFPVRFRKVRQVPADTEVDCTYNPTELYYANLYKDHAPGADPTDPNAIVHAAAFDDWDADGDGVFDEQHWAEDAVAYDPDHVDGCPDVAVGRLPAHTPEEASIYVEKVIRYESQGYSSKLEKLAFLADADYAGSTALCDAIAGAAPARRFLLNCRSIDDARPQWTNATFQMVDHEVTCSGWIAYVGHASARAWSVRETGREYDAARVARFRGGDPLRAVVFSVGCETGRFMCWAPSERYVDESGRVHEFVRNEPSRASASRCAAYDPFSSDYDQACEEQYAAAHPEYARRCNPSAAGGAWRDKMNDDAFDGRLFVPRPCGYDLPENRDRTFAGSWLFAPGAAIVYAGESLVCPNDTGAELVRDVLARRSATASVFGDLWLEGQRRYWLDNRASEGVFRSPRIYLGIMTLFGDPSLRVPGRVASPK